MGRDTPRVRRTIFQLAWPVFAENILFTLTQVVGMIMVGHLGPEAITAIGLSMQPLWLVHGFFMGLGAGTTALVARFVGAREPADADQAAHQSFLLGTALALVVGVVAFPFTRQIVALMGAEAGVVELGSLYLQYLIPGLLLMMVFTVLTAALRGAGDTRTPMWINAAASVLNLALSWVLIYGGLGLPAMGVAGAGLAGSISRSFGCLVLLALVFTGRTVISFREPASRLKWAFLKPDVEVMARVIRIGVPAALERLVSSLGMLFYTRVVAALGTVAFAAHSLALNIESLSYMPGIAFSVAATTLVGQNLGAGKPQEAESSGWECNRLGMWVMGVMGAVFFAFPAALLRLYTDDAAVIALGVVALRVVAFMQVPEAVGFILSGALRGAGDTRSVLYIATIGVWVARLGTSLVFVTWLGWGLLGAWLAMACDWVVRSGYLVYRFRAGTWKKLTV